MSVHDRISSRPEIEGRLLESRTFAPDPAFVAQANASAEIYEEAERADDISGQSIFAFVILKAGQEPSDALGLQLREHVAYVIGPIARPKHLLFTPDLPKTRSGKIMRRLLRDIAEGRALGDTTTLADAAVVDAIRDRTGGAEED